MTAPPVLLYRDTCPKCRRLSLIVALASLGFVHRLPIDTPEAGLLLEQRGLGRTKAVLIWEDRAALGWRSLPAGILLGMASTPARLRSRAGGRRPHRRARAGPAGDTPGHPGLRIVHRRPGGPPPETV